jgi:hypothetical protein
MTIVADWRVTLRVSVNLQAKSIDGGSVPSETGPAKRTNAKFLIACVLQLITLLVMLTKAMINTSLVAMSAFTSSGNSDSTSAHSL